MGLLDQVLGQVIGNMAGGGQGRSGGAPQGGGTGGGLGDLLGQVLGGSRSAPQGGGGGGLGDLLGQVMRGGGGQQAPSPTSGGGPLGGGLGSILTGAGGKMSPLILAVLAILANKHQSSGGGGFGSVLQDMLGGGAKPSGERPEAAGYGQEPDNYAGDDGYGEPRQNMGASPYQEARGGGRSRDDGGFMNDVGSMLDGPGGAQQRSARGGDVLGGDFDDLRQRFDQNGQGGLMDSWVGSGANREPSAGELEQALGPQEVDQLSQRFGIDRSELLEQLTRALPQVVDGLTPNGRTPTPQEQRSWL